MGQVAQQDWGKGRNGNIRNENVTNGGEPAGENEDYQEQDEYGGDHEYWGESRDVYLAGGENESPSDLGWGDVGNYGADCDVEQFLKNEETQGYEGLQNQAGAGVFEISTEERILRDRKGKIRETLTNQKETYAGV